MITNYAKIEVAKIIGGSGAGNTIGSSVPSYFIIGGGSGVSTSFQTELIYPNDRQPVTSTDLSSPNKITWIADWNSVEMSGLYLNEFGMMLSGPALTGSIWSRTNIPRITFDGTNELRVQETWEVY